MTTNSVNLSVSAGRDANVAVDQNISQSGRYGSADASNSVTGSVTAGRDANVQIKQNIDQKSPWPKFPPPFMPPYKKPHFHC